MAYATYTTDALVCGSRLSNTADRSYLLFTRELGMLWATARSVREERSRQRYGLQECSVVRVSLIKGKLGWRIGSTEALGNPFLVAVSRPARGGVIYFIKQLRRYIHGEQALLGVFDDAVVVLEQLAQSETLETVAAWQEVGMLRLLYALGYVPAVASYQRLLEAPSVTDAYEQYETSAATSVAAAIRAADAVSHL